MPIEPEIKHLIYVLAGYFATKIAGSIWEYVRTRKLPSKDEFEKLTSAMTKATQAFEKQGIDIARIYLFLKEIAGEKWDVHFEKIKSEENKELKNGGSK